MNFKKYLVSATAAALIATSALSVSNLTAQAADTTTQTNVITTAATNLVAYNAYSDEATTIVSKSMASNMDFTANVEKAADGKTYAYVTLKNSNLWAGMQTEVNGEMKEVTTVSENAAAKTKLVKFEVVALDKAIKTDIQINAGAYGTMKHTIYLKFDKTVETTPVAYNAYSDEAATTASKGMASNMDFTANIQKTADEKTYAYVTLKNADLWAGMQTEVNGEMKEVTTVSEDAAAKTKLVKFEVAALDKVIKTDIQINAGAYGVMKHTVYLKFATTATPEVVTPETTPATPEVVAPVVNPNKVVSTTKYNYSLVTKTKKAKSVANPYVVKPLTVKKTQSGKYYATVKLKNAGMWKSLKVANVNGKMVNVTTVSTDKAKKTKTVKFQVKSPTAVVKTTFTLNTKSKKLAGKYTNYFKLGKKYVKATTVTSTKKYNYSALKEDKKSVSATDAYMVKPVTIEKMSDGKYYATVKLKNASYWKSFKTEVNGKMVAVTTLSSDKKNDTKVVKFQVPSAKATVKMATHIKIASINYDEKYTNYFKVGSEIKK